MARKPVSSKKTPKIASAELLKAIHDAVEAGSVVYVGHAHQRLNERGVTTIEVEHVLRRGHLEPAKDQFDEATKSWKYAVRGRTVDERELRIAVVLDDRGAVVITVIDLTAGLN